MLIYKVKRGIEVDLSSALICIKTTYILAYNLSNICEYIPMCMLMHKHIYKYLYTWTSQNMSESVKSD